eukprot:883824-Rhodomonas_salina.1
MQKASQEAEEAEDDIQKPSQEAEEAEDDMQKAAYEQNIFSFKTALQQMVKTCVQDDKQVGDNELKQQISTAVEHLLQTDVWSEEHISEQEHMRLFQFGKTLRVVSCGVFTVARVELIAEPHHMLQVSKMSLLSPSRQAESAVHGPNTFAVVHKQRSMCLAPRDISQLSYMTATPAHGGEIKLQRLCIVPTRGVMLAYMNQDKEADVIKKSNQEFCIPGVVEVRRVAEGPDRLAFVCLPNPENNTHWANTWTKDMLYQHYFSYPDLQPL